MTKTLEITDEASKVIVNMRDKLSQARHAIGENDPMYVKMAESLAFSLITMLGLGGRITADGDVDLYCVGEFITYGVNFHSREHPDKGMREALRGLNVVIGEWSVNS